MEHSNLQKSEKGNLNLASRSLEFTQIKPDKYILTALFIRVTVYSLNPLPFPLFKREVLRLLLEQRAEEDVGEGRPVADSAGWRGASVAKRVALGLGHGQPWLCLVLASQATGSSGAAAEQCQDGMPAVVALATASSAANPAGEETTAEEQHSVPKHCNRGGEGAML